MALELKDVFTYLGFDEKEITDIDKLKAAFSKKYDTIENFFESQPYKAKRGEINGAFTTMLKREAGANGVELTDEELSEMVGDKKQTKETSAIVKLAFEKFNKNHAAAIVKAKEEAEKNAGNGGKEWKEKYELTANEKKQLIDENERIKKEFEVKEKGFGTEIKKVKLQTKKDQIFKALEWKKDITPLEQAGFTAIFESKYDINLDDKDEVFITDKKGNRISNPETHNAFKSPADVLKEEAIANKVFQLNKDGGKPASGGGIFSFGQRKEPETPAPAGGGAGQPAQVISDRARAATAGS